MTGYFGIEYLPHLTEHLQKYVANDVRHFGMDIDKTGFCLWVSKYKECKVGEHIKLPFDFPYNKAVYDCHNYERDGKLWKKVD